ncbi:MAG TPA: GNAT family N-acetyltransferase, partial [Acidimicrobiales bacterium]|nr:GNAT family N-acetyltransferase [Acidimicrobiales bacterium]
MLRGDQVTLRPMTGDDVEPLTALFAVPEVAEWWPGQNSVRLQTRLGDDDEGVGMVIERDGRLIGFIQYFEETDPDYRHAMVDIVLHPDWTDRG